jgi:hypothetical protein
VFLKGTLGINAVLDWRLLLNIGLAPATLISAVFTIFYGLNP